MKRWIASLFICGSLLFTLTGGSGGQTKPKTLRELAKGLPASSQKIIEEYIQENVVWQTRLDYVIRMKK